jgi:hypothetical protein
MSAAEGGAKDPAPANVSRPPDTSPVTVPNDAWVSTVSGAAVYFCPICLTQLSQDPASSPELGTIALVGLGAHGRRHQALDGPGRAAP